MVVQLGFEPNRIDLLTEIEGVPFEKAWKDRVTGSLDGLAVSFISREDLITNKRTCARPQDLVDVQILTGA